LETIPSRAGFVTIAQLETEQKRLRLDEMKRSIASHPLVTAAIQVLGAELKDVRLAAED
jgi:DNA polymerase-3 subunit gamma/tau